MIHSQAIAEHTHRQREQVVMQPPPRVLTHLRSCLYRLSKQVRFSAAPKRRNFKFSTAMPIFSTAGGELLLGEPVPVPRLPRRDQVEGETCQRQGEWHCAPPVLPHEFCIAGDSRPLSNHAPAWAWSSLVQDFWSQLPSLARFRVTRFTSCLHGHGPSGPPMVTRPLTQLFFSGRR